MALRKGTALVGQVVAAEAFDGSLVVGPVIAVSQDVEQTQVCVDGAFDRRWVKTTDVHPIPSDGALALAVLVEALVHQVLDAAPAPEPLQDPTLRAAEEAGILKVIKVS